MALRTAERYTKMKKEHENEADDDKGEDIAEAKKLAQKQAANYS